MKGFLFPHGTSALSLLPSSQPLVLYTSQHQLAAGSVLRSEAGNNPYAYFATVLPSIPALWRAKHAAKEDRARATTLRNGKQNANAGP